jgi:hypothetical protein
MEIGKTYKVIHKRKGEFVLKIIEGNDVWVKGLIVDGVAQYLNEENKTEGELIEVRRDFLINMGEQI